MMKILHRIGLLLVSALLIGCGGGGESTPVNQAPEAVTQTITLNENQNKQVVLNATDAEGNSLSYKVVTAPIHGTFKDGIYTPTAKYVGSDSFTFIANDGTVDSAPATITITITSDFDGDDISDVKDTDDDNDGTLDLEDAFPLDATESIDTDSDGIGNNADIDDDNDGVSDADENIVGTNSLDATSTPDPTDTDGDGTINIVDTDDDGDGVIDTNDIFPLDSSESIDTDGDGTGNNADTDDDNDGVSDIDESIAGTNSLDATSIPTLTDPDGDGVANVIDTDDDNDGVLDVSDAFPLDATESIDTDGDGIGNNSDSDDDNDGVLDTDDAFPLDATENLDTDGDGIGNNADSDDDNDGVSDMDERAFGSDPLDATSKAVTISGKITYDLVPANSNNIGLDYNSIRQESVKNVKIDIVDGSNSIVETTTTDDTGDYSVSLLSNKNVKVRVYAKMIKTGTPSWDVKVVDNTNEDALYVMDGSLTRSGISDSIRNLNASALTKTSPPFAILNSVYQSMKKVLSTDSSVAFPPLKMNWSVNNIESGTYYDGNDNIMILGDQNGDSDEYDDHIIIHEWGHYFEAKFSRADSIGGQHGAGEALDIRLAFGEGFGNALSGIVTDDPIYFDTYQSSGWSMNVESAPQDNPGWFSEASIQRILYDLYDDNDDGSDVLSLGFKPLYDVLIGTQKTTSAFTSIFTFIKALKDENIDETTAIDAIVSSEKIATIIDIWGTGRTNSISSYPYHELIVGTSVSVETSNSDGVRNKLSNHQYVKFTIATAGDYTIKVNQTNGTNSDPDFTLFKGTPFKYIDVFEGSNLGVEESTLSFEEGDYLLDIIDARNILTVQFDVIVK